MLKNELLNELKEAVTHQTMAFQILQSQEYGKEIKDNALLLFNYWSDEVRRLGRELQRREKKEKIDGKGKI